MAIPVFAAGIVLLAAWRPWRRSARSARSSGGEWGLGFALSVAFLASFIVQEGWPWSGTPAQWYGVLILAVATALLSVGAPLSAKRRWSAWAPSVLIGGLAIIVIHPPGADSLTTRAGLGIIVFLLAVLLTPVATRRAVPMSLGFMVVFGTLAVLLLTSHFAKLAFMTGSLAIVCALAAFVAWRGRQPGVGIGGCLAIAALAPGIALIGYAYDYDTFPAICWILAIAAIPAVWVAQFPPLKRIPPWISGGLAVLAVALPCAVAILLAVSVDQGAY